MRQDTCWAKLGLVALLGLTSTGCITILQAKKARVQSVRRVAIVGYQGVLQLDDGRPKNGIIAAVASAKNAVDRHSGRRAERRLDQGALAYQQLSQHLSQAFGWEVVAPSELSRAPRYRAVVERSITPEGQYVPGVLRPAQFNAFSPEERRELCAALGVDALATAQVRFEVGSTSGFALAGVGSSAKHPFARVHFELFDASGETIWRDYDAHGRATKDGLRTTMGADIVENETEVLTAAATSGFEAVMARYRGYAE